MNHPARLISVVLLAGVSAGEATAASDDAAKFLHDYAASLTAHDADKTAAFYEDSDDVVAIQSTGRVCKGMAQVRAEYVAAFEEVVFTSVTLNDLVVRQTGDVAWATCTLKAETVRNADPSKWSLEILTSFVIRRCGDTWKIVLEQSTPKAGVPRVQRRE
jgi:uncharacterized protein (TIGR02246 family)